MQMFNKKLACIVALSSLAVSISFAAPATIKAKLDCPSIAANAKDKVTNYGTYLAGTGFERFDHTPRHFILFQGTTVPGANIPKDLVGGNYKNSGVVYNPSNGAVVCKYKSSTSGNDPFNISYMMQNGLDGVVTGSGMEEIHIKLPIGLK